MLMLQFSLFYQSSSNPAPYIGYLSNTSPNVFELFLDPAFELLSGAHTTFAYRGNANFHSDAVFGQNLCMNLGTAWTQPNHAVCMSPVATTVSSTDFNLALTTVTTMPTNTFTTILEQPSGNFVTYTTSQTSPSTMCQSTDMYTLSTTLSIDLDYVDLPVSLANSEIQDMTSSGWANSEKLELHIIDQPISSKRAIIYNSGKYDFWDQAYFDAQGGLEVNQNFNLLSTQKDCIGAYDLTFISHV